MKKFRFNLESVLKYRVNTENNEKSVLAGLHEELSLFERQRSCLCEEYSSRSREFEELSKQGVTVHEIRSSHAFLKNIDYGIEVKTQEIEEQNKLVERQTAVVVRAMQDTKTLDKLKEGEFRKYEAGARKAQEKFVEEFVLNGISRAETPK